jgi:hypothetical protein
LHEIITALLAAVATIWVASVLVVAIADQLRALRRPQHRVPR